MSDVAKRLTEYLTVGGFFNPELMEHDKVRDLLIDCRTEIEHLREERRWIPVGERLPPVGEKVCVIEEDGTGTLIGWIAPHRWNSGHSAGVDYNWTLGDELDSYATPKITHWQSLPSRQKRVSEIKYE
jgi:hypothetical protein